MNGIARRAVVLGLLAAGVAARADALSKADAAKVRDVIRAQLDAFAADDAARAFSYASSGIQRMFGTPERFIDMVRRGYPVVLRPASVSFLAPAAHGGEVLQAVEMVDADGAVWVALYRLERQKNGTWRIAGCELQPVQAQGT